MLTPRIPADEPSLRDNLGHASVAKILGDRIHYCDCPYVQGICGSWGSGKTSFLRKVWAYLGGSFPGVEGDPVAEQAHLELCRLLFGQDYEKPAGLNAYDDVHLVWFNPWHHQFEQTPLVALLYEIRQHLSMTDKALAEVKKLADVTVYSALSVLADLGKAAGITLPGVKPADVMARGREYESENFMAGLTSQTFRTLFEKAIAQVIGPKGRLVIFIDDLDRCEGEVAYRLLEALKLYLNAQNCVYVLGIDRDHLEYNIARVLSKSEETWRYRPLARDYLAKMFQSLFLLPVPERIDSFISSLLCLDDTQNSAEKQFLSHLQRCGLKINANGPAEPDRTKLLAVLNQVLPHNPRKIKSFITSWKLYLQLLSEKPMAGDFDWRLTLILHYLGQFEEPIFRGIEASPEFFDGEVVRFCREGRSAHPFFEGLELPYKMKNPEAEMKGGFDSPVVPSSGSSSPAPNNGDDSKKENKPSPLSRTFWISSLVLEIAAEGTVGSDRMRQHLYMASSLV